MPPFIQRDLGTSQIICQEKNNQLPYLLWTLNKLFTEFESEQTKTESMDEIQLQLYNILVKKGVLNV